ncbi:hypothetical protein NE237_014751 [Protea cynaroides]|uniref:Uncharacterized protein n=1 Tax=Protea cynaroides TaxID=273540 RepID=A0A9Q0QQA1_9MAGN|nr:hypothetical protein NE237_014751 [Protea cynaroides]
MSDLDKALGDEGEKSSKAKKEDGGDCVAHLVEGFDQLSLLVISFFVDGKLGSVSALNRLHTFPQAENGFHITMLKVLNRRRAQLDLKKGRRRINWRFGSHIAQFLALNGFLDGKTKCRPIVLPDQYIEHGSPADQMIEAGLTPSHIAATVFKVLGQTREALEVMSMRS